MTLLKSRSLPAAVLAGALAILAAATGPTAAEQRRDDIYCGPGPGGAVSMVTSEPKPDACATAQNVAQAYSQAVSGDQPATVQVAGATWNCGVRQGDPNTYLECVSGSDAVRITS
ncbi:hypothetical protein HII36_08515 [Nonomuraea sp. NN258]|uniref:hypothetical protein n=1 Tax=Nonomuraea antri TaxID=2730852 RepID=UPI0015685094|nr:hypothetical protein [Nonomuraea antri]NRQ31881.1 hypothetical protein [Nonomuraea antri]